MRMKKDDVVSIEPENSEESPHENEGTYEEKAEPENSEKETYKNQEISSCGISHKKIGIFENNWIESKSISPCHSGKIFSSFHSGTIIREKNEVERLKSIGAPIKVYIEDGSN